MKRALVIVGVALLAGACGSSSTTPTPPPPPTEDPPKITCPAAQTAQLAIGTTSIAVTYPAPTTVNGRLPVTVSCTPASGASFGVGQATVVCTATDGLQRSDTCSFTVTVQPAPIPKLAVTRFFAFGDSITKGEDGNTSTTTTSRFYPRVILPDPQTYPGALKIQLVNRYTTQTISLENWGNPSEGITDGIVDSNPVTFDRFRTLTSSGNYDAVLLMEGTNDVYKARNGTGDPNAILSVAEDYLHRMLQDAKSRNIRPLLATIPPMNPTGFRGMVYGWELVEGFNNRVRAVAAGEHVPLVDVYAAFGGNLALLSADGVHPNANGYQKIADTFFAAIKSNLETPTSSAAVRFRRR